MGMQMEMSYVVAVVITGLVVVFLGLILLIAFISIIGAIFKKLNQKGTVPAKTAAPAAAKPFPKTVVEPAASTVAVVSASGTDDDEIIAVISAAVAMMSAAEGKNYKVRSVRAVSSKASGGNAWASAGLRESTNPF